VTEATRAFYVLLHAQQAEALARSAEQVSSDALGAARTRYEAGEVPILDVNVARIDLARSRQQTLVATANRERAAGDLRAILAMERDGSVVATAAWDMDVSGGLDAALDNSDRRADLRALAAAVTVADAEWQLARTQSTPDLIGGVGVKREEGKTAVGARVGLSLPVFRRYDGDIAVAAARVQEAKSALAAQRIVVRDRVRSLYGAYLAARQAVDVFQAEAIPSLEENDKLARESYEAGKVGLVEYLLLRRETVGVRQQQLDATLAATLAALDVRAAAGFVR